MDDGLNIQQLLTNSHLLPPISSLLNHTTMSESRGSLGKVLVIGSNGFLGHHIVAQLLDSWTTSSVVGVDLRCDRNRRPEADYRECDITDTEKLASVFDAVRPDLVVHTASPVGNDSKIAHDLFKRVNVDGTQAVVDACRKADVKALVYTSSASVMSDNVSDLLNADERWPMIRGEQQTEYYSETKVPIINPLSTLRWPIPLIPPAPGRRRRTHHRRKPPTLLPPPNLRHPPRRHLWRR